MSRPFVEFCCTGARRTDVLKPVANCGPDTHVGHGLYGRHRSFPTPTHRAMGWPDYDRLQDDDGDGAESRASEAGEKSR